MKKITIMILCLAVTLGLSACTSGKDNESKTTNLNNNSQLTLDVSSKPSSETSKVTVSNSEPASSSQIEASSEKNNSYPSNPSGTEFNEKEYQKLGEKLLKELEQNTASNLTFFDVANKLSYQGYEPIDNVNKFQKIESCTEIEAASEISEFKKLLKLDQWQTEVTQLKSTPKMFIYFGSNLHVNLEGQDSTGKAWMSINSPTGSVYYSVPKDVYETILEKYKEKE